jgi:hypothetical protein
MSVRPERARTASQLASELSTEALYGRLSGVPRTAISRHHSDDIERLDHSSLGRFGGGNLRSLAGVRNARGGRFKNRSLSNASEEPEAFDELMRKEAINGWLGRADDGRSSHQSWRAFGTSLDDAVVLMRLRSRRWVFHQAIQLPSLVVLCQVLRDG